MTHFGLTQNIEPESFSFAGLIEQIRGGRTTRGL